MKRNDDIFIMLPSFHEPDLMDTVISAYENAGSPENVFIGVCNQKIYGEFEDFSMFKNVAVSNITSPSPRGLGIAMLEALYLWKDQYYVLRVDAHTVFVRNWDILLKENYEQIEKETEHNKIIISHRPSTYEKGKNGEKTFQTKRYDYRYGVDIQRELLTRFDSSYIINSPEEDPDPSKNYVEHFLIAAGEVFSTHNYFFEVMPDPRLIFFGEEYVYPMRAWTRGFRIFSIHDNISYTLHKTPEYLDSVEIDFVTESKKFGALAPLSHSHRLFFKEILMGNEYGYYGATDPEMYDKYIEKLGFNYRENIKDLYC